MVNKMGYFAPLTLTLCLATSLTWQATEKVRARDLFLSGSETPTKKSELPVTSESDKTIQNPKTSAAAPLGLRYSILKQMSGGETLEVDPDSIFHSGDRIRLSIEANDNGYLYIVLRGSSGNWSLLFPSNEILGGNNTVEKGGHYEIPLGTVWFAFDEHAGREKLFIVLSRQPEPNLEKLIQSLRQDPKSTSGQEPAGTQVVDDEVVGKIRNQVASRDLILEKVNENSPGEKKEKAVYVVNRTGSTDSRVVVDVSLNHQ